VELLRKIRNLLRVIRHLPMRTAVAKVNEILRGWINYFRVGNSGDAFKKVQWLIERKVRRFAAKKRGCKGFGWKRWSNEVVYGVRGLFVDYRIVYIDIAKVGLHPKKES
ncbi:MAG: group II intron maturase-specific domain-containing protein, partial [Acidobacteriota bacterium]